MQYKAKVIRLPNPDSADGFLEDKEKEIEKIIENLATIKGWTFKTMVGGDVYVLLIFDKT